MDDSAEKQVKRDDPTVAAERPEPAAPGDIDDAEADDFAARAFVSNAFVGSATPVAGMVVGTKEKLLEELTDEERAKAAAELDSKATRGV